MIGVAAVQAHAASGSRSQIVPAPWLAAFVAAVLCFALVGSQRSIGLGLRDEGFLWYGAQRVLAGEIPIRDFQAYDPGRYFWVAGWMALLGDDGILALRWANAVLAAITVALATLTVGSGTSRPGPAALAVAAATFTLWMVPHIKVSDAFAVVILLFGLARLIRRPSMARYFQGGVCLGLASTIGINHAFYGSVAAVLALLYLRAAPSPERTIAASIAGVAVGYSPVLALHLFAPGYSAAFLDSIRQLFENGATNLFIPLPDPLAISQAGRKGFLASATESLSALLFLGVPLLWLWAGWRLLSPGNRNAIDPAVPAGLLLSIPYAHYAYSRADMAHVAISILPVLAAALAWVFGQAVAARRWLVLTAFFGASLVMTLGEQPAWHGLRGRPTEMLEIDGHRMLVRPDEAAEIRAARTIAAAAGPAAFFSGPYLPGAYALARRKSPVLEIYQLFPATPARQRAEIARLRSADVRHALISRERVEERSDLGLDRTHPLLLAYLQTCLDRVSGVPAAPLLTIRTATGAACAAAGERR